MVYYILAFKSIYLNYRNMNQWMDGWMDVYMNERKYKKYHKMLSIALLSLYSGMSC